MSFVQDDIELKIEVKNPDSQWVTVDEKGNLISEGKTPDEAIKLAKEKTEYFTVLFVPKEGNAYIF